MLRSFAIAFGTVVALAAVHPAEARQEARSSGKAARATAARPTAAPTLRPAFAPRPAAAPATSRRMVAVAPRGRAAGSVRGQRSAEVRSSRRPVFAVRGATRREALRYTDLRPASMHGQRNGLRFVSLFSAAPAAASTLPARGGKYAKAAYTNTRDEGAEESRGYGRMGVWHAGLPAADGEQMDCPAGTMAVLARGHTDTFRCMPM
ncbi:hypothetical protein [Roseomonas sp. KE2513]|uniref:hypothetical protein n=1 Tax=Roseomonas sp. KE2513 TaxID=2479202 RepID=UPI0018E0232E|nr:hypothetical protein [Roseomonas sp. KE2513]